MDNATILRFSGKPYRKPRDVYGAPLDRPDRLCTAIVFLPTEVDEAFPDRP